MNTNKSIAKILSVLIIFTIVFPSLSYGSGEVYKDETVYVNLDNEGKDIDKYSSVRLHSNTSLNKVEDKSILKKVENVKGDEEGKIGNGKIVWETDEKDIYYQGKIDKDLPIKPKVKYHLDGEEVEAEDIAGESGELKIEISIENTDKRSITLKNGQGKEKYAPYIVATTVILPMDKFENLEASTGKILSDGSNQILNFISLPGLEESLDIGKDILDLPSKFVIKADVVDFEMAPIVFTATSEIPEMEDLDIAKDLDELLDGIDSIVDASEKLNEATGKIYHGQGGLNSGINELVNGLGKINEGTDPLYKGSLELKNGIDTAYKGSLVMNEGTGKLSKSADQLGEGFTALGDGTIQYSSKALEFSQGANEIARGIGSIPESTSALSGGMVEIIKGTEELQTGQDNLTGGLGKGLEGLMQIKAGKEKEAEVIEMVLNSMDSFDNIVKNLESIPGAEGLVKPMAEGLEQQRMALQGITNSSDELIAALSQLEEGLNEAQSASKGLSVGIRGINQGQIEVDSGLNELGKGVKELEAASKQLEEASIGLEEGANILNKNARVAKEGVGKFTKGGNELAKGSNSLSNGLEELSGGANSLNNGVSELSKGSHELSQGGEELQKGSQSLLEGSNELNQGMGEFYEDGIKEMDSKVNSSDLDIKTTMEVKDELVGIAKDNTSFTGISENMEGSLKFIMKTEGVNVEVEKQSLDIEEEVEVKKGFINWIKGLFK